MFLKIVNVYFQIPQLLSFYNYVRDEETCGFINQPRLEEESFSNGLNMTNLLIFLV